MCLGVPTGCHPSGQGILMFDGSVKPVEDVRIGDALMGPDSRPRRVLDLHRGHGAIYSVVPVKGTPFKVNAGHILTVKLTNQFGANSKKRHNTGAKGGIMGGDVRDIPLQDYLATSSTFKHLAKLFRVPIYFHGSAPLPISPYVLGMLLGDGSLGGKHPCGQTSSVAVHNRYDIPELYSEASKFGIVVKRKRKGSIFYFGLVLPGGTGGHGGDGSSKIRNPLAETLEQLGLRGKRTGDKSIPQQYKVASRDDRLELIAGLIDSDGSTCENIYDFISKSKKLADGMAFVCRSVGLAAYVKPCVKGCETGFRGRYYRVSISGDCSVVPSRFKPAGVRRQVKSALVTGFKLQEAGQDDYFGFVLDGDGRYLLDDFTVTHNSGKSLLAVLASKLAGQRTVILTATKGLQQQIMTDFSSLGIANVRGQNNFVCTMNPSVRADEGPCHDGMHCTLKEVGCPYYEQLNRAKESQIVVTNYAYYLAQTKFSDGLGPIGLLVLDEAHMAFSALESHLRVYFGRDEIESLGIHFPRTETPWPEWRQWAQQNKHAVSLRAEALRDQVAEAARLGPVPSSLSRASRTAKNVERKMMTIAQATGAWVPQKIRYGWQFTPIWVAPYGALLFQEAPKVMLMSAILTNKTVDAIGVPSNRKFLSMGSSFPVANTPVWHVPTARINYRTDDYGTAIWSARIDQIMQRRMDRKGIIFTVSYKRRDIVLQNSRYAGIMVSHGTSDVIEMVRRFKDATPPAVLVSPSVTSGYDFPGDSCRYIIIGKLPYPDVKDPVMVARMAEDKEWSSFMAMETLVQEAGRGTRSVNDKCEVLIIDDSIVWFMIKYKHFAPEWFLERYRGSLTAVPDPLV